MRELRVSAEVIRYRRERWLTPSGETVVAPLPAGTVGGFGPELRRFILALHAQGQVTMERLTAFLEGIGVALSKRQIVRLLARPLDDLVAEDQEVLRAGLATARWVTVDDTTARHARKDGVTTQLGDGFTVFRTGASKSRAAFLALLRAGHDDYVISEAALDYMHGRSLAEPVIETLAAYPAKVFASTAAWQAHLAALGIDQLKVTPDPVLIATEGALWGAIHHHGLLTGTVVVSDDAGQFRIGTHALSASRSSATSATACTSPTPLPSRCCLTSSDRRQAQRAPGNLPRLQAHKTNTLSQDHYRAALAGIDNLLTFITIPER